MADCTCGTEIPTQYSGYTGNSFLCPNTSGLLDTGTSLNANFLKLNTKLDALALKTETEIATKADITTYTTLNNEVIVLKAEIAKENATRTAQDTGLQSQITALEISSSGKIGDLSTLKTSTQTDLVSAVNEVLDTTKNDDISTKITTLEAQVLELQNKITELETKNTELQTKNADFETRITALEVQP